MISRFEISRRIRSLTLLATFVIALSGCYGVADNDFERSSPDVRDRQATEVVGRHRDAHLVERLGVRIVDADRAA